MGLWARPKLGPLAFGDGRSSRHGRGAEAARIGLLVGERGKGGGYLHYEQHQMAWPRHDERQNFLKFDSQAPKRAVCCAHLGGGPQLDVGAPFMVLRAVS